ncbi:hypothetical protein B0T22DRAFT_155329 [Podospora appendiculata]|uniref:DUF7053 domain-containing protein n=1 Tax=Podospora appendiculata TaxID=314037 RepID=A0AAE0X9R3_9PEZI|nr:hypothetical protein B0T22DRAFT_155329 [Podospora appendiculata]
MTKRTTFTTITPLPRGISRQVVVDFLHDHLEMIDLNPLVKERHPISPPAHATEDEQRCTWFSLTDRISYLPGRLATGDVSYTCAFFDLPTGLQTHCYAPAGLDIRDKWTLNGSLPGERVQPVELGIGAPQTGLYLREDVDMKCNVLMTSFVKKTLKRSHAALVERLTEKAQLASAGTPVASPNPRYIDFKLGGTSQSAYTTSANPSRHSSPASSSSASASLSAAPRSQVWTSLTSYSSATTNSSASYLGSPRPSPAALPTPPQPPKQTHELYSAVPPQCNYRYPPPSQVHEEPRFPLQPPQPQQHQQDYTQPRIQDQNLYPEPLRLAAAQSQAPGGPATRTQWEQQHPDYPHMNPYSDGGDDHKAGGISTNSVAGTHQQQQPHQQTHPRPRMSASLGGPFVAELE